jgi:hypothetical protein
LVGALGFGVEKFKALGDRDRDPRLLGRTVLGR